MKSNIKGLIFVAVFLAAVVAICFWIFNPSKPAEVDYPAFKDSVTFGEVKRVSRDLDVITYTLTDNSKYITVLNESVDSFNAFLENARQRTVTHNAAVRAKGEGGNPDEEDFITSRNGSVITVELPLITWSAEPTSGSNIWSLVITGLGILVLVVMAVFIFRSMNSSNKQAMNFGKSGARANDNIKVKFNDVAGADEEKEELKEIVDFLKSPAKFTAVGARIPRGVLLVGPPGTGKTLFAKAVAGEANVPFFSISGSDFVEMFVGVGASRVRDLFDQAKRNMPCIIFIDEIDAVGRQRGTGLGGGHDEREQTLNQLLVQMDGFETNDGIIVMAATNRADILDPALLRPGRFDRQVYVNTPDVRGREAILRVHARNKPVSSDVDFKLIARITSGFTGADLENLLNEAAILAAREDRKEILTKDLNEGINKVIMGPQKKSRLVTEVDKRITAYHEAGHAIVAKVLPHCDPVHEVSIIPRGGAAGYTMMRPDNDDDHVSRDKLKNIIAMSMGGRAAEELVIKDFCTGASQDIKNATNIAKKMVTQWGMSDELGPVFFGSDQEVYLGRDYTATHTYSEVVAAKIDAEVRKLVEEGHQAAIKILRDHREIMDNMARILLEKETIYAEEVDMLMEGKSVRDVIRVIENKGEVRAEQDLGSYKPKKFSDVIIDDVKIGDFENDNSEDKGEN